MTETKKTKKMPGTQVSKEHVKKYMDYQKEADEKLKELIYEDRNGFKPPKPWYEND